MVKKRVKKSVKSDYKKEHLGLSSFTLAIAGFFVTLFTPVASFIMFVVSLVFSAIQQKKNPTKLGKVALILSIIGIIVDVLFVIFLIKFMNGLVAQGAI